MTVSNCVIMYYGETVGRKVVSDYRTELQGKVYNSRPKESVWEREGVYRFDLSLHLWNQLRSVRSNRRLCLNGRDEPVENEKV